MDEPGFRFHPTDQEIVGYYLARKAADPNFTCAAMGDLDIYKFQPRELPGKAKYSRPGDVQWWFYNFRGEVKAGSANRTAPTGYWKRSGKQHRILLNNELAGIRNGLVFYVGRNPAGKKTGWILHEYRLMNEIQSSSSKWAVCCVFNKESDATAPAGGADAMDPTDVPPSLQSVPGAAAVSDPLHPVAEQSFGSAVVDDPLLVMAEDSIGGAVIHHDMLPVPDDILDNFFLENPIADIAQQPHFDSFCISDFFPTDPLGQLLFDFTAE